MKSRCSRGRAKLAPLLGVLAPLLRDVPRRGTSPPTADIPRRGPPRAPPTHALTCPFCSYAERRCPHVSDPDSDLTPAQDDAVRAPCVRPPHRPAPPEVVARLDAALAA